jgi:pimeloyl-ACP methyl ester carboxylesterase
MAQRRTSPKQGKAEHLVVLVAGIRDFGMWKYELAELLRREGFSVELVNAGWINLLKFLLPVSHYRRQAEEQIGRQVRLAAALHPGADISIIAHSFGSYVVANLLEKEGIRIKRLILCGSVLPSDFDLKPIRDALQTRPDDGVVVVNDVGAKDPFPALAASVTWGYGSAGSFGFGTPGIVDRFHLDAGHSTFLTREFCQKFWLPFLRDGTVVSAGPAMKPRAWLTFITAVKLKYLVPLLIIAGMSVAAIVFAPPTLESVGGRGWVLAGFVDDRNRTWQEGQPFLTRDNSQGGVIDFGLFCDGHLLSRDAYYKKGQRVEVVGQVRRVFIRDFKKDRTTDVGLRDCPVVGGWDERSEGPHFTGVTLPIGTKLVVRDVAIGHGDGNPQHAVWLLVAPAR